MENCLTTYDPHAFVLIYSITDRSSFQFADEILKYLWRESYTKEKAVILVGNKVDLARSRIIKTDGNCHDDDDGDDGDDDGEPKARKRARRTNRSGEGSRRVMGSRRRANGAPLLPPTTVARTGHVSRFFHAPIRSRGLSRIDLPLIKWPRFFSASGRASNRLLVDRGARSPERRVASLTAGQSAHHPTN